MSFRIVEKVMGSGSVAEPISVTSLPVSSARIQVKRANSNAMEISPVAAFVAGKGYELVAPTSAAQLPELPLSTNQGVQGIDLSLWYIRGTQGEGVNIIIEEY